MPRSTKKIYLAGPEVFLPDAVEIGKRKKELCESYGFVGLFPLDNELAAGDSERLDHMIYEANLALIRGADIGVCNLTPFRGPSADVGTVFELGMLLGLSKPVLGYTNDPDDLLTRTVAICGRALQGEKHVDQNGMNIEDFKNCDNLMIDASLAKLGCPIVRATARVSDPYRDLQGFEKCLEFARAKIASA